MFLEICKGDSRPMETWNCEELYAEVWEHPLVKGRAKIRDLSGDARKGLSQAPDSSSWSWILDQERVRQACGAVTAVPCE